MTPTSLKSLLAYGGPAVPLSMLAMPLIVYIPPFYAIELGLDLAAVGLVFLIARMFDGLIDPAVAYVSDRTRSKWGRRKPWIIIGAPLLVLAAWAICQPPQGISLHYLIIATFIFYLAWTVVQIPYLSWGVELSRDYNERTQITAFREGGLLVGTLLATGLPLLIYWGQEPSLREILFVFALSITILVPLTTLIATKVTPSMPQISEVDSGFSAMLNTVRVNAPFRRLIFSIFMIWFGVHIYNACVLFLFQYVIEQPVSVFLQVVFIQFLLGLIALPLIIKFVNATGKHIALAIGALLFFASLALFLVVEPGNRLHAYILFSAIGVVTPFVWVVPPTLVGDALEYGILKGAGDEAGLYMSMYTFAQKAALALSVGISLPLLKFLGFDPENGGSEALVAVGIGLPLLIAFVGIMPLWRYPLTEKRHAMIRKRLDILATRIQRVKDKPI